MTRISIAVVGLGAVAACALLLDAPEALAGGVWILAGLVAGRRTGALMLATGAAWLLAVLDAEPLSTVYLAVAAHLVLAFPDGRLAGRPERAVALAAYAIAVGGQALRMLVTPAQPLLTIQTATGAIVTAALVVVLSRRYAAASAPRRRVLSPVVASGGALALLAGAMLLAGAAGQEPLKQTLGWTVLAAFAAVPCAFLIGGVRDRLRRAGAYRVLATRLERPVDLRLALAEALGDPGLQLAYALPGGGRYVTDAGLPVELPGPREWTAIARAGRPIAALVHDAALAEDAEHVRAVGATAALALENERLAAELRARIAELSESRARIVDAAEAERRRIERDLHDGAQQRLAGLALELGLALDRLERGRPEVRESLLAARRQADSALVELRALAHGILPPLLDRARASPPRSGRCCDEAAAGRPLRIGSERLERRSRRGVHAVLRCRRGDRERAQAREASQVTVTLAAGGGKASWWSRRRPGRGDVRRRAEQARGPRASARRQARPRQPAAPARASARRPCAR